MCFSLVIIGCFQSIWNTVTCKFESVYPHLDDWVGSNSHIASCPSGFARLRLIYPCYPRLIGISTVVRFLIAFIGRLLGFPWSRWRPIHIDLFGSVSVFGVCVVGGTTGTGVIHIDLFGSRAVAGVGIVGGTTGTGIIHIHLSGSLTVARVGIVGGTCRTSIRKVCLSGDASGTEGTNRRNGIDELYLHDVVGFLLRLLDDGFDLGFVTVVSFFGGGWGLGFVTVVVGCLINLVNLSSFEFFCGQVSVFV
mmetsp:Transcript_14295/g.35884  ORF Transcript_14295/g.35884 Transcript_14295/m.35884 type:complete len:250 (-) Transcript_14295:363-1112(-)